jgi:putative hydrolase of the HAD superfamily
MMKIFFDVDGVLIDGWHADSALRKPWDATIEVDLGVDREAFQQLFFGAPGSRSGLRMFECIAGRSDLKDALAAVLPQVGYKGSVDDFTRYWFEKDSNVNAGMFELIDELRGRDGTQMFVATGQEHHRARYLWDELGFSKRFDGMFYSAEIGFPKTDVRFFAAINHTAEIGFPKTDVRFFAAINHTLEILAAERPLFFDDQPEIVELARREGWDGTTFTSIKDIQEHSRVGHLLP